MRLIDADLAIEELTDRSHKAAKRVGTDSPFWEGLVIARRIVNNLPTIQPEPQEGHWIRRDCGLDVECKCSRCGYKDFVKPRDEYWFKRNYCPNCGAKMTISTK